MLKTVLAIAITSFLIISCNESSKGKIVYLYPSVKRVRYVKEGELMMERFKQLGYQTQMIDADDNESLQIIKGMEALNGDIDLLVITPINGHTIAPLVRKAKEKGVKVIAYNRLISNVEYDLLITGDNINNAEIMVKNALSIKPTGNYVVLAGDRFDRNGVDLKNAIDSLLSPKIKSGQINLVYETQVEAWNQETAAFEINQVIDSWGTDIDAVIACSDPMANGTINILKRYGLAGKVFVSGQDATDDAIKNIAKGNQHVTIYHPHKKLGYTLAELADKMLKGQSAKSLSNGKTFNGSIFVPTYHIKSIEVTQANYKKVMTENGEYKP
jgi:D-xylose transport system substrate-binding protein